MCLEVGLERLLGPWLIARLQPQLRVCTQLVRMWHQLPSSTTSSCLCTGCSGLCQRGGLCTTVHHLGYSGCNVCWHVRLPPPAGFLRTYVLELDPAQYQLDVNATAAGEAPDVYATFNVLMRRDAKENNFKV